MSRSEGTKADGDRREPHRSALLIHGSSSYRPRRWLMISLVAVVVAFFVGAATTMGAASQVLPPITTPPVTLPPVTLPPVTVPAVTLPPVTVPPVTPPPSTLPPATVPAVTVPPVTVPPVTAPPVTVPAVTLPPATVPPPPPVAPPPAPVSPRSPTAPPAPRPRRPSRRRPDVPTVGTPVPDTLPPAPTGTAGNDPAAGAHPTSPGAAPPGITVVTADTPAERQEAVPSGSTTAAILFRGRTVAVGRGAGPWLPGCHTVVAASTLLAAPTTLQATLAHAGLVVEVAFSPDGTEVATASVDGTARLWDPRDRS